MKIVRARTGGVALVLRRVESRPHRRPDPKARCRGTVLLERVHDVERVWRRSRKLRDRRVASLAFPDVKFPARRQRRRVRPVFRRSRAGRRLFDRHTDEVLLLCSHSNGILWVGRHKFPVVIRVSARRWNSVAVFLGVKMILSESNRKTRHALRQVEVHNVRLVLVWRWEIFCGLVKDSVSPEVIGDSQMAILLA